MMNNVGNSGRLSRAQSDITERRSKSPYFDHLLPSPTPPTRSNSRPKDIPSDGTYQNVKLKSRQPLDTPSSTGSPMQFSLSPGSGPENPKYEEIKGPGHPGDEDFDEENYLIVRQKMPLPMDSNYMKMSAAQRATADYIDYTPSGSPAVSSSPPVDASLSRFTKMTAPQIKALQRGGATVSFPFLAKVEGFEGKISQPSAVNWDSPGNLYTAKVYPSREGSVYVGVSCKNPYGHSAEQPIRCTLLNHKKEPILDLPVAKPDSRFATGFAIKHYDLRAELTQSDLEGKFYFQLSINE